MHKYIDISGYVIPSYGLCMVIAIFLCAVLITNKSIKNGIGFDDIIIISAVSLLAAFAGGELLYIIVTYSSEQIYQYIKNHDFSFVINGGIVFYGGLIGGILGGTVSAIKLNIDLKKIQLCIIPYIPIGHAIGRIGCLLAGCCHGFEYNGIFAVRNYVRSSTQTYFPVQAVEALANIAISIILIALVRKKCLQEKIIYIYLNMYSVMRFIVEFFRGDLIRGDFMTVSTSQWISLLIIGICTAVFVLDKKKNRTGK